MCGSCSWWALWLVVPWSLIILTCCSSCVYCLRQGCQTPVLKGHSTAGFGCFPAPTPDSDQCLISWFVQNVTIFWRDPFNLNQVHWSRETSETCGPLGPEFDITGLKAALLSPLVVLFLCSPQWYKTGQVFVDLVTTFLLTFQEGCKWICQCFTKQLTEGKPLCTTSRSYTKSQTNSILGTTNLLELPFSTENPEPSINLHTKPWHSLTSIGLLPFIAHMVSLF